jgi:predicted HTH transcriptional regulator
VPQQRDIDLVNDLRSQPAETTWLEFKVNQGNHDAIAKLVSALSNAARLEGKETAFLVWGVEDGSHNVVGTSFDPLTKKVGNQVFELWLRNKLSPAPAFQFRSVDHPEGRVVLLEIPADLPRDFSSTID